MSFKTTSRDTRHSLVMGARLKRGVVTLRKTLRDDVSLAVATAALGILVCFAVVGPMLWRVDPLEIDLSSTLASPSLQHPMGTDAVGRDVLAMFNRGAQISLVVGALVVTTGALVGGVIGLIAGTLGGFADNVLMRLMDSILAFPALVLAMAVTIGMGVGLATAAVGIIITSIPWYSRLVRSEVLKVRSQGFIEAAIALGMPRRRIILRHVVPHVTSTLLIQASGIFGYAILTLAALGFVGLGAQIPTPEWGAMITESLRYALTGQWWIGFFPGLGLLVAVTSASIITDRLRDIFDPHGDYQSIA